MQLGGDVMTSREVICFNCKHQFRAMFRSDNEQRIRNKRGKVFDADLAMCPKCRSLQYLTHNSLVGLDANKYNSLELRLE